MESQEFNRLVQRVTSQLHPSSKAVILFELDCTDEIKMNTFGDIKSLQALKLKAQQLFGKVQEGGKR